MVENRIIGGNYRRQLIGKLGQYNCKAGSLIGFMEVTLVTVMAPLPLLLRHDTKAMGAETSISVTRDFGISLHTEGCGEIPESQVMSLWPKSSRHPFWFHHDDTICCVQVRNLFSICEYLQAPSQATVTAVYWRLHIGIYFDITVMLPSINLHYTPHGIVVGTDGMGDQWDGNQWDGAKNGGGS